MLAEDIPGPGFLIRPATETDEVAALALWQTWGLVANYNDPRRFPVCLRGRLIRHTVLLDAGLFGSGLSLLWAAFA